MPFEVMKMHKLQDQLENLAYDWAYEDVCEYYSVEDSLNLTKEQVEEILEYSEDEGCCEGYVSMALRSICDNWYDENGDVE